MPPPLPAPLRRLVLAVVPFCVLLVLAYADFAVLYRLGYVEIYQRHSHGSAVVLWVLFGFFQVVTFYYGARVYLTGPGRSPVLAPLDLYGERAFLPEYFMCDEHGYPFWCTACQSLKAPRSFHSRRSGYCILKFDHFCIWLGCLLGVANYVYFLKLVAAFVELIVVALVFLIVYTKANRSRGSNSIDGNFIAIYVVAGFWFIMATGLLVSHIWYIARGTTTLDDLATNQKKRWLRYQRAKQAGRAGSRSPPRQEDGRRYINMRQKDGSRVVVRFDLESRPYSFSSYRNWIHLWLNGNSYVLNQWLPESNYTPGRFVLAVCMSVIPFAELFLVPKLTFEAARGSDDPEVQADDVVQHYNDYNERISPKFRAFIDSKIAGGEYKVAVHYQAVVDRGESRSREN